MLYPFQREIMLSEFIYSFTSQNNHKGRVYHFIELCFVVWHPRYNNEIHLIIERIISLKNLIRENKFLSFKNSQRK